MDAYRDRWKIKRWIFERIATAFIKPLWLMEIQIAILILYGVLFTKRKWDADREVFTFQWVQFRDY